MDIKDCTQTQDGRPVRIYATDGEGRFPVHGAVFQRGRGWAATTWTEGGTRGLISRCELDLMLSDWRDEIPWGCLRDEIQWVARDGNSDFTWWGFSKKPTQGGVAWQEIDNNDQAVFDLEGVKMPHGPADWREAIAQRPGGGE